jgi:hypothetical protein
MVTAITRYFDKLEDKVRTKLSHRSILYAIIGGIATIILWRSIWHIADMLKEQGGLLGWFFYEPVSAVWCSVVLLMTGLFVSQFIGERIIISGLKNEKKITDRTEDEVRRDDIKIDELTVQIAQLSKDIKEIKDVLAKK